VRHPFRERWHHNTHYPRLRDAIRATARTHLDIGCGEGTLCRYVAERGLAVSGVDVDPSVLPRDDARSSTRDVLPGSTYRRLPLWRYLGSWTKPT
jgi:2-polyprenyl-3-methyl-5-hydroxy-6-metoxy-1,4-benzoquinol methylase